MVDSGASVNVCPKWFGNSKLEQSDDATCLKGANGKPLQEFGKRQIWLKICGQTKRYDFHVVDVTKPILSASCLCENGAEFFFLRKNSENRYQRVCESKSADTSTLRKGRPNQAPHPQCHALGPHLSK